MIYIIITSSLESKCFGENTEHRKNRYMFSILHLLQLVEDEANIKVIIVENNGLRSTCLDELPCDVMYTENNRNHYYNKGVNELLDIQDVIQAYSIQDNDIVIKLTGRYKLLEKTFIDFVKTNSDTYDAFIKFFDVATNSFDDTTCVLGLYALRCKYLKAFHYESKKSPESEFTEYVKNIPTIRIKEIQTLYLECCFACNLNTLNV